MQRSAARHFASLRGLKNASAVWERAPPPLRTGVLVHLLFFPPPLLVLARGLALGLGLGAVEAGGDVRVELLRLGPAAAAL